jgi:hypothetical protein
MLPAGSAGLLVGLSILSLNQFAENVSKADALSVEIASIHKGLQNIVTSPHSAESSPAKAEMAVEDAGMTRF